MSGDKSTAFAIALVDELFNKTSAVPNITAGTSLYLTAHTADPAGGSATLHECAYDSYARKAMLRGTDFAIAANQASNLADEAFPQADAGMVGTETITHIGLTVSSTGGSLLLYSKSLAVPLVVGALVTPKILAGQLTITET